MGVRNSTVGAIVYVGLLLIGVRFPLALALVAAIGEAVPLVGPYVAAVPILAAAVMSGPFAAGATLVLLVAVKQFEAYLLLPHLTSQQADVPPLLWLAAPMTGLLVQPIVGALSDRTWGLAGSDESPNHALGADPDRARTAATMPPWSWR